MAQPRQYFPWGKGNSTFYLVALFLFAAAVSLVVAVAQKSATAAIAGAACFMAGGLLGFLFGIPRYAASATDRRLQVEQDASVVKYQANTNLEQISDWLTKIIVGIGLTQFRAIGTAIGDAADDLAEAFDGTRIEALSLMITTFATGFLFFYLWSRVYLPRLFADAEASTNRESEVPRR